MRRSKALGAVLALSWPMACARDPVTSFNEARIEAICSWYDRCEALEEGGYADMADCRSELAAASKAEKPHMNCDNFSQGEADACVAAWDVADCTTPPDLASCESVCEN